MKNIYKLGTLAVLALALFFYSKCGPQGNFPGREYMPDMGHAVGFEANTFGYYRYNMWGTEQERYEMSKPRTYPEGTIARGKEIYHYEDTDADRARATREIVENPVSFSKKGFERGKQLYGTYCGVCHGAKGDGNGILYNDGNGPYPLAPANLLKDTFKNANDGLIYHAIMYGRNAMGSYKDKLDEEERWLVINYIRNLQGAGPKIDSRADILIDSVMTKSSNHEDVVSLYNVFFNTGSAALKQASMIELEKVASALKKYPKAKVVVNGHTDNVGDAAANLVLSKERAAAVMAYLMDSGIAKSQLTYEGFGSNKPVSSDPARNRRVDLSLIH
jgi:outer membrane protein OmpA-like peptidoglycan-associated protein